jgi:AcrR family transcriptional regulator
LGRLGIDAGSGEVNREDGKAALRQSSVIGGMVSSRLRIKHHDTPSSTPFRLDNGSGAGISPKRQAIERAAAAVFLRDGYAGASVDEIAREAAVSKATLYSHFRSKEELFCAIIGQQCGQFVVEAQTSEAAGATPEQILRKLGQNFLGNLLSPHMLALYRVVAGEAYRFPALGRMIYESGPAPAKQALAGYFRDLTRKGRLVVKQPEIAADQFFGALLGGIHFRQLLGVEKPPSRRTIDLWVEKAVATFIAAHTPR